MQKAPVGPPDRTISDTDLDAPVSELAEDGFTMTKEDAQHAVRQLSDLLLLVSCPIPLSPPPGQVQEEEAPPPSPS